MLQQRKELERKLQELEILEREFLSGMKNKTVKTSSLLVAPTISSVFEYIEKQKQKGDIPSEIRKDLIEKILNEKRCICGNIICEGTDAHDLILKWLNRTSDVTAQDAALNLWRFLSDIQNHFEDVESQIQNDLIAYSINHNDIFIHTGKD